MRRIFLKAPLIEACADLFWELCANKIPFQVGGMETAAIPLLIAIMMKSIARGTPVNGFIIRKERKTYGTGSLIEGTITEDPIIIVDDIMNSGSSLEKTRVILEQGRRAIMMVFVMIDYHAKKGLVWRTRYRVPMVAPFQLSDFNLSLNDLPQIESKPIFHNVWSFGSPDANFSQRVPKSFPATDGERVYFGSDNGTFWCLDARNGKTIWTFKVHTNGHKNIWSAPALHDGRVCFGSYDGNVYCLDTETGNEIWRFTGADWVGSSPALAPDLGLLFIGLEFAVEGKRGSIVALSLRTGKKNGNTSLNVIPMPPLPIGLKDS